MEFQLKDKKTNNIKEVRFLDFNGNVVTEEAIPVNAGAYNVMISKNDAKRVGKIEEYKDGTKIYFIKAIKFGFPGELLANPFDSSVLSAYNETDSRSKTFYYMRVNKDIFDIYTKFLYTRNESYFLNVTRRIKDGEV